MRSEMIQHQRKEHTNTKCDGREWLSEPCYVGLVGWIQVDPESQVLTAAAEPFDGRPMGTSPLLIDRLIDQCHDVASRRSNFI